MSAAGVSKVTDMWPKTEVLLPAMLPAFDAIEAHMQTAVSSVFGVRFIMMLSCFLYFKSTPFNTGLLKGMNAQHKRIPLF